MGGDNHHITFDEKTPIPAGWLIAMASGAGTFIIYAFLTGAWKSEVESESRNTRERVDRISEAYKSQNQKLDILIERTGRIEGLLEAQRRR